MTLRRSVCPGFSYSSHGTLPSSLSPDRTGFPLEGLPITTHSVPNFFLTISDCKCFICQTRSETNPVKCIQLSTGTGKLSTPLTPYPFHPLYVSMITTCTFADSGTGTGGRVRRGPATSTTPPAPEPVQCTVGTFGTWSQATSSPERTEQETMDGSRVCRGLYPLPGASPPRRFPRGTTRVDGRRGQCSRGEDRGVPDGGKSVQ